MAHHGFSHVPDRGFMAFLTDLSEGAWSSISVDAYTAEDQQEGPAPADAPTKVICKLRMILAVDALRNVLNVADATKLAAADEEWDAAQRALYHRLSAAADDEDPETAEAARRLSKVLLAGEGKAQTKMAYDKEVDFGRQQISLTRDGELAAATAKLDLGRIMIRIDRVTEALAKVQGRGSGQQPAKTPSRRKRDALRACAAAFKSVYEQLGWLIEITPAGSQRDEVIALQAPFIALQERYSNSSPGD